MSDEKKKQHVDTPEAPKEDNKNKVVTHYTITQKGLDEVVTVIDQCIASKYIKQAIFSAMNDNITPVSKG